MKGKISSMLRRQKKHISFHTPGHKRAGADITELSYSDNLLSPRGVIKEAEEEIAKVLGAERSFLLTDGSTAGIHAMLYAIKRAGAKSVALSPYSHRSVKEGCAFLNLETVEIKTAGASQPGEEEIALALHKADALLLTSPDYYGFFPPLEKARALCTAQKKPLLLDGAHGAHLHFSEKYAGRYADLWVDGVHKSLPALTQGAVVSAGQGWGARLCEAVKAFRTTSPSYPIMASVENAVLHPRNVQIEVLSEAFKEEVGAVKNEDWSKVIIPFGTRADEAQAYLEKHGIYPEFNDGNFILFYLSPCTKPRHLKRLKRLLKKLPRGEISLSESGEKEQILSAVFVPLSEAAGRIAAVDTGIFPPCIPLVLRGERFTKEAVKRLQKAANVFGIVNGTVLVSEEKG